MGKRMDGDAIQQSDGGMTLLMSVEEWKGR
jgi:hypothetical protein